MVGRDREGEKREMDTQEWHKRYKNRLIKRGLSAQEAENILRAGGHDYDFDPEDSADDELSYMVSDG